jgi:hypothetical protein
MQQQHLEQIERAAGGWHVDDDTPRNPPYLFEMLSPMERRAIRSENPETSSID